MERRAGESCLMWRQPVRAHPSWIHALPRKAHSERLAAAANMMKEAYDINKKKAHTVRPFPNSKDQIYLWRELCEC